MFVRAQGRDQGGCAGGDQGGAGGVRGDAGPGGGGGEGALQYIILQSIQFI
jgi:hypothetical protein